MSQGSFVVIHPNGGLLLETFAPAPTPEVMLLKLQAAVGGYIEHIEGFDTYNGESCLAFCNEYGKLDGLPTNRGATKAWADALGFDPRTRGDWLAGPVAIVTGSREWLAEL